MTLTQTQWLQSVAVAARAPSPHNAQPARWQLCGDEVRLLADSAGWLAAGDPAGRDDCVALGMAWEGMALALSTLGFALSMPRIAATADSRDRAGTRLVATGNIVAGAEPDSLASQWEQRRSFRGTFAAANTTQLAELDACIADYADTATPIAESLRRDIARWYDAAAAEGLRNPAVTQELYRFMRFSRSDPRWALDGLAADCLQLGRLEAFCASLIMRPAVLALVGKLGLLGLLVSEKPKVLSAARLVVIQAGSADSCFDAGRRWYRFWLALCGAGFSAVPMSALKDSPRYSAELLAAQSLPPGRWLLNVMRIGPSPVQPAPQSARRSIQELIVTGS